MLLLINGGLMAEWWVELAAAEKVFVGLAIPFTLLTIVNIIMELVGAGADHTGGFDMVDDVGFADHFHFFSVRNMIYFLMMFGWTGLACSKGGLSTLVAIPIALLAGVLTSFIIGWIFFMLSKLQASGTTSLAAAVGKTASVYLPIPATRNGSGVIQIVLNGRTLEMDAITDGDELSRGVSVEVKQVLDGNKALVYRPEIA
ncbi:hypothetical protein ACFLQV_01390 [Calditrichota bacterium]